MSYRIRELSFHVRETPPGRMSFTLGSAGRKPGRAPRLTNPLVHARLVISDAAGHETFGTAADRMSVRWLDKRPGRSRGLKLREMVELIEAARELVLAQPQFPTAFDFWKRFHPQIMKRGAVSKQEPLTSSFVSALLERAVIDAVCRAAERSVFDMVAEDQLGFHPAAIHPELKQLPFTSLLPETPLTEFAIRHTVGAADPLRTADIPADQRVDDGLPESLEEYIRADGIQYFKVKVTGDVEADLRRLDALWGVVLAADQPVLTLDANESYTDLRQFEEFVKRLERDQPGLFQHLAYIEQPLPRTLTFDPDTATTIRRIAEKKPLLIDEADDRPEAFREARKLGYQGTSHKNCKGFFKSLANLGLVLHAALRNEYAFLSGEDLQNLPVVPLHQDFATLGILGLDHCERNGHHYNYGLSFIPEAEKRQVAADHPDLYRWHHDEAFLRIEQGRVQCASLQCPGFGVKREPNTSTMQPLRKWLEARFPPES